jgi:phosphonate dehydrogenase
VLNQSRGTLPTEELMHRLKQAHAMMAFMPDKVDDAFLQQCPNLKVVGAALKGYDNFDVEACTRHNVWFTIVPDLLTNPTAELAIGLMLSLARNIGPGDQWVRSGDFQGWLPIHYGSGLDGATVGLLGMGRVGQAITRRLSGFGARLLFHDPRSVTVDVDSNLKVQAAFMEEVLSHSDFIICAVPLNSQTKHLINSRTIVRMKRGSYLINIGRGSTVDEQAVAEALDIGHLAGYAADVFEMEDWALEDRPRFIHPSLLAHHDRTIFTPHLGSAVDSVRKAIAMEAGRNIIQALTGETPQGAVNHIKDCNKGMAIELY